MTSWTRRTVCLGALTAPLILRPGRGQADEAEPALAAIEQRLGGRLGVLAGTQERVLLRHRADELFPMCSTFKVPAAASVLARVDAGSESLDRLVTYGNGDLLNYAPVVRKGLEAGGVGRMTISDLCAAVLEWSDNSAANLLLKALGGPEALTLWLRSTGDPVTRLDRNEPTLNQPGGNAHHARASASRTIPVGGLPRAAGSLDGRVPDGFQTPPGGTAGGLDLRRQDRHWR
jgi:beta-lactamase class A